MHTSRPPIRPRQAPSLPPQALLAHHGPGYAYDVYAYDVAPRPAIVVDLTLIAPSCTYDAPARHDTTASAATTTYWYVASGVAESTAQTDDRIAANPTNCTDPTGTTIVMNSNIDGYLKENHVSNFTSTTMGDSITKISAGRVRYSGDAKFENGADVTSEILADMIKSSRDFVVTNGTLANLELHVQARLDIIKLTEEKRAHFGEDKPDEAYWEIDDKKLHYLNLKKGAPAFVAVQNGIALRKDNANIFACGTGAFMLELGGVANAMATLKDGQDLFDNKAKALHGDVFDAFLKVDLNVPTMHVDQKESQVNDWIPGDWGWIKNAGTNPPQPILPLLLGENVIYIGNNKWFNHSGDDDSHEFRYWINTVVGWGSAEMQTYRIRPKIGLDN